MYRLFSVFFCVLLYVTIAFGQVAVEFPLTIENNVGDSRILYFGLDLTATDGIDEALGESDLPPFPFSFEARFILPPFSGSALSSYLDYRAPGDPPAFPFTGQIEHRLKYQTGDDPLATEITITWNFPSSVSGSLKDIITGTLINVTMTGSGSYTVTDPTAFNQLKMFIDYTDITPVELSSFTAMVSNEGVLLKWITATELNNQGFEIERASLTASPSQVLEKIGYVPGYGTTTESKSYCFMDENITTGLYSYRLKQIDFDGTFNYSDEVVVEVDLTPAEYELFQNYPNPFNPSTSIQFQVPNMSDVTIKIYDMLGQEIRTLFTEQVEPGKYTVEWNGLNNAGSKMSSGSYIYRMTAGEFVQTKEMILLK